MTSVRLCNTIENLFPFYIEATFCPMQISLTLFGKNAVSSLSLYRMFSHDVTAAMLVSQDKEMAAMLVCQTNLWELNSIFMQILSFISVNQYGR